MPWLLFETSCSLVKYNTIGRLLPLTTMSRSRVCMQAINPVAGASAAPVQALYLSRSGSVLAVFWQCLSTAVGQLETGGHPRGYRCRAWGALRLAALFISNWLPKTDDCENRLSANVASLTVPVFALYPACHLMHLDLLCMAAWPYAVHMAEKQNASSST